MEGGRPYGGQSEYRPELYYLQRKILSLEGMTWQIPP